MHPNDSAWQAFRVSLLSPLITGEILHEDREAYFQKLAKESHYAPDVTINKLLLVEFFSELLASTMYRHLRIRGATKTQLRVVRKKVRCRWTCETPNSLWMADFSHGPLALVDGTARQTYLSV